MVNNVISGNLQVHHLAIPKVATIHTTMSSNAQASSSKQAGRKEHVKGGGKGKGRAPAKGQPRMKSNLIKRQQGDEELKDLQGKIDAFVSLDNTHARSTLMFRCLQIP